jgi:hypothetical protein
MKSYLQMYINLLYVQTSGIQMALLVEVSSHPDLSRELQQQQDTDDLGMGLLLPVMNKCGV